MQLQLAALVVDKDNTARENATLVAENMDKRGRGKKSVSLTIPDADEAKELGKKLAIMCEAWSDSNSFLKPRPDLDPNSEERYSSFETYKLGITSAIYDFLPAKCHKFLQVRSDWCTLVSSFFFDAQNGTELVLLTHTNHISYAESRGRAGQMPLSISRGRHLQYSRTMASLQVIGHLRRRGPTPQSCNHSSSFRVIRTTLRFRPSSTRASTRTQGKCFVTQSLVGYVLQLMATFRMLTLFRNTN